MLEQMPGDGAFPQLVEAGGEAGEGGIEMITDLAVESGDFAEEIATLDRVSDPGAADYPYGGPGSQQRSRKLEGGR